MLFISIPFGGGGGGEGGYSVQMSAWECPTDMGNLVVRNFGIFIIDHKFAYFHQNFSHFGILLGLKFTHSAPKQDMKWYSHGS